MVRRRLPAAPEREAPLQSTDGYALGNAHDPSSATPEHTLPRWARAADVVTAVLAVAALQALVFGGLQMPGLSITNPWRPLAMAVLVAGLRHCLIRVPPGHEHLWRWTRRIWLADAAQAARREHWPAIDLKFFRTLDFLVLSVVSISFTAVALLAVDRFDARIAVISGLILGSVVRWFTPARFDADRASAGKPVAPVLLLVLLTGLLFRTAPFPSLDGGRQPGLYAGMSAHLQREGSAFVDDPLPDALPDQRSRDIYRAGAPEGGGPARPGLLYSPSRGDSVFALYPLHPLWMAVFAELFGDAARFHALGLFGLLGVLGLSLLAFELTGSRPAAFAAGILVATNPLHVFFSRSPDSAAVALAFSSLGFYYLARAFRGMRRPAPAATAATLVTLGAACVSLVFFVRASGFAYLAALVPLFALGVRLTPRNRRVRGRQIIGFCTAVAALYGVSALYGLGYAAVGAPGVREGALASVLGDGWPLVVAGLLALAAAALAEVARDPHRPAARRFLAWAVDPRPWIRLASLLVAIALAGSLLQAYRIGSAEPNADALLQEPGLFGSGTGMFLQSGAVGWLLYVSPWLAAVAVRGMHRAPRRWPVALLYLLVAVSMAAVLLRIVPVIPQHYDDARHLLGEIVPYSLVVAVAVTFLAAPGGFRRVGMAAIVAAVPYQLFFTASQMPVREGVQPYEVMRRIARHVDGDVLLFDADGFRGEKSARRPAHLQTPMRHYFDLHLFPYHGPSRLAELVQSFEGVVGGRRLWLLTADAVAPPGLELYDAFDYHDRRMDGAATIPATINEGHGAQTLFLYRQPAVCAQPDCDLRLRDRALYSLGRGYVYHRRMLGPGWHGAEEQQVWSGPQAALTLSRGWFPSRRWPAAALLEMRAFTLSSDHAVTLTARSGTAARVIRFDDPETVLHEIPLACPIDGDACHVDLTIDGARSPREVLGTDDARELGVAVSRIGFRFRATP